MVCRSSSESGKRKAYRVKNRAKYQAQKEEKKKKHAETYPAKKGGIPRKKQGHSCGQEGDRTPLLRRSIVEMAVIENDKKVHFLVNLPANVETSWLHSFEVVTFGKDE